MATNLIDEFVAVFRLNLDDFRAGQKEVDDRTRKLKDGQKRSFDEIEEAGKSAGIAVRGLTREVVGLGLAFMGASSIGGFLKNMATGAASADRFGQTLGLSVRQVWAWRQAMAAFGGSAGDADSSLAAIQGAKMQYVRGGMDAQTLSQFGMLGISGQDLQAASSADILRKLAGSKMRETNPQFYANSLQQIGLSAPMVSLLMQGQSSVDKLISTYEENADGQERLAKETEKLYSEMADLNTQIQGLLVPELSDLVDALGGLVSLLNLLTGKPSKGDSPTVAKIKDMFAGRTTSYDIIGDSIGGPIGGWIKSIGHLDPLPATKGANAGSNAPAPTGDRQGFIFNYLSAAGLQRHQVLGIMAGMHAENAGFDPDKRGGFMGRAVGVGQWLGDRRAELLRRYGAHPSLKQQLDFLLYELRGGDGAGSAVLSHGTAHGTMVSYLRDFMRPQGARGEHMRDLISDVNRGHRYLASARGGGVNIGSMTIVTQAKDANGIARDIHGALKRRVAVAQNDRVVRP
jgi:hypothetical protein